MKQMGQRRDPLHDGAISYGIIKQGDKPHFRLALIENPVTAPISESNSEEGWVTVWEGTSNILNFIDMEEPVEAMFVRITFTDWTGKVS